MDLVPCLLAAERPERRIKRRASPDSRSRHATAGAHSSKRPGFFCSGRGRMFPWPPRKNGGVPPKSADCRYTLTATRARSLHAPDADLKRSSGARLTPTAYSHRASSSAKSGSSRTCTTRGWPTARRSHAAPVKGAWVADESEHAPGSSHSSFRWEHSRFHAHGVSATSPHTAEESSPPARGHISPRK